MPNNQKLEAVKGLKEKISKAKSIILVDYKGITVAEDTVLRKKMRENGIDYIVAKNRLFKLALKEAGVEADFDKYLKGTTAFAISYEDPVSPAKTVTDFAIEIRKARKDKKFFTTKGGLLEGKIIDAAGVKELADLPSRDQLIAMMLAGMQGPIAGFVNVLSGTLRSVVTVIDAIRKQKEEQ